MIITPSDCEPYDALILRPRGSSVRQRNAAALRKHCKGIARDPTSIDGFSMGTIPEGLGQNCLFIQAL